MVTAAGHVDTPASTVLEAASWTLAAEMTRRHPHLTVLRYHPGGGLYDCLAIRSERGAHVDLNRVGSIHIHAIEGGGMPNWEPVGWSAYLADPQAFLALLEERVRLPHVEASPPTTPRVLSYRVLAAFARLHVLGTPVEIGMSTIDTSGMGGGQARWITHYPAVQRAMPTQPFGYWRARSKDTEFVIETESATLHRRDGSTLALPERYSALGRNFGRLMGVVLTGR